MHGAPPRGPCGHRKPWFFQGMRSGRISHSASWPGPWRAVIWGPPGPYEEMLLEVPEGTSPEDLEDLEDLWDPFAGVRLLTEEEAGDVYDAAYAWPERWPDIA